MNTLMPTIREKLAAWWRRNKTKARQAEKAYNNLKKANQKPRPIARYNKSNLNKNMGRPNGSRGPLAGGANEMIN